jgi:anthranilate/para-aminobenzoate synthase component I
MENNIFSSLESFSVPESESDASHARKVDKIKESIRQGHFYQLNYGRKWSGNMPSHPWHAFQRMMEGNPLHSHHGYMFMIMVGVLLQQVQSDF